MPKNILIFSDGTGQAGGVRPDQKLSNIYKMYRATRTGPDSPIDPEKQVAFYDAGLGTDEDAGSLPLRTHRFLRKALGSITGTGISKNIRECYEAILKTYEPGDRIYLFGFSRGAYTVRCLANVLTLCGVPRHDSNGLPLRRYGSILRSVAKEAVESVYEHSAGGFRNTNILDETREKARRFRVRYGSNDEDRSNVIPYFIGVFDTVAALGLPVPLRIAAGACAALTLALLYWLIAKLFDAPVAAAWFVGAVILAAMIGASGYFLGRLRVIRDYPVPGKSRWHFASGASNSYDLRLDPRVEYARHALAIDEVRKDFARVGWGHRGDRPVRGPEQSEWLIQLWFAGCHSDIGGSYGEEESRLSDITLSWMLDEVSKTEHPILVDPSKLHLFPSASGMQHCEMERFLDRFPRWWPDRFRFSWPIKPRIEVLGAPVHESVMQRFNCNAINDCGRIGPYRPETLKNDDRFSSHYAAVCALTEK